MKTLPRSFTLALILLLTLVSPVAAAGQPGVLFGGYWAGFTEYWQKVFQQQDGIGMAILGLGVVSLFIITRGKWKK